MGNSDRPPPQDGWGSENKHAANSAFEDDRLPERQITLTLRIPPLKLPGEEGQAAPVAAELREVEPATHLDAWNVDRVQRSSFPPSAGGIQAPPARLIATTAVPRDLLEMTPSNGFEGDALALAGRHSTAAPALDLVSEMAERFALGDFSGCLRVAQLLLGQDPEHTLAAHYARESHEKLESHYVSRLTSHGRTPTLIVPESEIHWLGLDSRVGLLVSHIDGFSDVDGVVTRSGMARLEGLRCLLELVEARVVRLV